MPIEKLTKILHLEAERYQDRAVYGGLARYADTWVQEARGALGPQAENWIAEIRERLHTYSVLPDLVARKAAVATLLDILENPPQVGDGDLVALPTSTSEQSPGSPPPPERSLGRRTGLSSSLTALHGVGPRQAERLARLGLHEIQDMLFFFPRRHDDYSQLEAIGRLEYGTEATVIAQVARTDAYQSHRGTKVFKALLQDPSGSVEVTWFNQPYLARRIKAGQQIVVSGKVDEYLGRPCFTAPEWELVDKELLHTARLVPVYPLTDGIHPKWLRSLMKRTVDYWSKRLPDHLPGCIREENGLVDLETAIVQAHFPDSLGLLRRAKYRLAFDELFVLQVGLLRQRHTWRSEAGIRIEVGDARLQPFVTGLPYQLTSAQSRALQQIAHDMRSGQPMNRLLQGDVGSGKTVVAVAAMTLAVAAGAQAAMMAPTEILAEQHYRTLDRLLNREPGQRPTLRLLTGSVSQQERDEIYRGLADGSIDIVVGTHALIQEGVQFAALALAVIDEQHRFGVRQRAALRQKGYNPHLLVMTATPIPRSLELTVWGHMDVSVIDELPPGRQPVTTRIISPLERERAYAFVRSQIEKGHQAFIICPLVEDSDKIEAKSAVEEFERLGRVVYKDLRLGLLHGRMGADEKDATMGRFVRGELDILVATSVVEVGVDVPNATVMLIEGADRFGLAQLHQFRGRVGRGGHASYCLLVSEGENGSANERLQAVEATTDGFVLAEKDLEMRGPGEFLGTRQSGLPKLRVFGIDNLELIEAAREAARRFFDTDPELADPDNRLLARQVAQLWKGEGDVS
jgi:ATP-dependent DNA helicase RecG